MSEEQEEKQALKCIKLIESIVQGGGSADDRMTKIKYWLDLKNEL